MIPLPPTSTLFPYTTLFRSRPVDSRELLQFHNVNAPLTRLAFRNVRLRAPKSLGGVRLGEPSSFSGFAQTHEERSISSGDRKSTRLNSSHSQISYAVFCLKK